MCNKPKIHIGTSGWNYKHWRGAFYPPDLAADDWLAFYSGRLSTVEINNSFYQLPEEKTFKQWRDGVPDDFIFSVKASRYITHMKKLKDPGASLKDFLSRVPALREKLGVILFQLPPRWRFNRERLQNFLTALPDEFKYTFEFRDSSWWRDETYQLLREHNAAFCMYQLAGKLSPKEVTSDVIYIRLHGPGRPYQGQYDARTLSGWAGAFNSWRKQGKEIYCYFDNDEKGYAAGNALQMREMISG